jgi:serine/threonine protein kinase/DNA-binding beta-propeller fold protein YncE
VGDEYPEAFSGPSIGSQIAGYQLEELIGRGGMAVVYRAYDPRLDRRVALKVLAPALALDDGFRRRFIRESRAAAAVDHPNIIPIFDAGEADHALFIAMRLVRGGDVRALARAGPVPLPVLADITTQVAAALDAAHLHGLVHRDVKPANMLLDRGPDGGRTHVYLADFGLSKRALSQTAGLTSAGEFLGTLDYVAPEQIESRSIDGRADQYALASAAFELLCGSAPFRHVTGLAVAMAKMSEPPPRPTDRRSDLPPATDDVIRRGMAIAPTERFRSCGEFAAALREALGARLTGSWSIPGPRRSAGPDQAAQPVTEVATSADEVPAGEGPAEEVPAHEVPVGEVPAEEGPADQGQAETVPSQRMSPPTMSPQTVHLPKVPQPTAPAGPSAPPVTGVAGEPGQDSPTLVTSAGPPIGEAAQPPRRPRWRSPRTMSAAAAVVVIGAGMAVFVTRHGGGTTSDMTLMDVKPPGCSQAVASAPAAHPANQTVNVGENPAGLAVTPDGKYSFVTQHGHVVVLNDAGSGAPSQVETIYAPGADHPEAITSNGKYLLAAEYSGAYVISVQAAEAGASQAILGMLTSDGQDADNVAVSPDGRFAFVTLAGSGELAVFDLDKSIADGFGQSGLVGVIPVGQDPTAVTLSPNGRWLYVTSFDEPFTPSGPSSIAAEGKLYVLNAHRAETDPGRSSVVSSATAGCGPSGVMVSADGSDVWVTAQRSDAVVAFSASKLTTDPQGSVIATVAVGVNPNSPVFIRHGKEIMVADSNLHGVAGADSLALISTERALAGRDGLLRLIAAGPTPWTVAPEPGRQTVLVTDNGSGQVQAIDTGSLP